MWWLMKNMLLKLSSIRKLPNQSCPDSPFSRWESRRRETDPILHITSQMHLFSILTFEIRSRALKPWKKRKISYLVSIIQAHYKYLPPKIPLSCYPISLLPFTSYLELSLITVSISSPPFLLELTENSPSSLPVFWKHSSQCHQWPPFC